jgi:hypothetical protein
MTVALIPVIVFLASAPICIRALVLRDRLLAGLYSQHRGLWEQLGHPTGWMWRAPSGGSFFPEVSISFGMLRSAPPNWLTSTPDLRDTYFACRRMARIWNFVAMPVFGIAIAVAAIYS